MPIKLNADAFFTDQDAIERILPMIREIYGLTDKHPVLEDMRMDITPNGTAALTIRLGKMLTKEQTMHFLGWGE